MFKAGVFSLLALLIVASFAIEFTNYVAPFQLRSNSASTKAFLWFKRIKCLNIHEPYVNCFVDFSIVATGSFPENVTNIIVSHPKFRTTTVQPVVWRTLEPSIYEVDFQIQTIFDAQVTLASFAADSTVIEVKFGGLDITYEYNLSLRIFASIIPNMFKHFKHFNTNLHHIPQRLRILIYGSARSGKTTIVRLLRDLLTIQTNYITSML